MLIGVVPSTLSICYILRSLGLNGSDQGFDESAWGNNVHHMIASMIIVANMSVKMVKDYFKIKSSKTAPQYRF